MESPADMNENCSAYSELVSGAFDEEKVKAAAARARQHMGARADFAIVFVSCELENSLQDLIELIQIHAHCPKVVGCSAGGLINVANEQESGPGFSLLVLRLPQAETCILELPVEKRRRSLGAGSALEH